ncbi:MAG: S8/S53 family peptidase [Chitinophagales bacterium]
MPLKKHFLLLITVIFFISYQDTFAQETNHTPGDLIVMVKKENDVKELIADFTVFNDLPTGLTIKQQLSKRLNIFLLHFDGAIIDESKLLSEIRNNSAVSIAQFNHFIESRNVPNDPRFGEQWNMLNIGQTGGTLGADVRATSAWDITTGGFTAGGDTIVIAIDDDGFDLVHEDLEFWKNHHEIPGNLIDDDENGYVDDYDGWNSQNNSGVITSLSSGHGTHVAGIAGAKGNNSLGVTGVNWNVKILPVQGNSGTESIAVAGYAYILEVRASYNETNGAAGGFVVSTNSSWGTDFGLPANFPIWCAMYDSMGAQGILSAAATSNSSNVNVDIQSDMPTACSSDYLISVTNTDKNDNRTAAFGATTIDLGAPGSSILSTIPGNGYGAKSGTSMASPHVAGAIALICSLPCDSLSNDLKNNAAATMLRIKKFILDGVDPVISLDGNTVSGGRLNVNQALLNAAAYYNCNVGVDEITPGTNNFAVFPNPATEEVNVVVKDNSSRIKSVSLLNLLGQEVLSNTFPASHAGVIQINVSLLKKGCYFLMLETEDGSMLSHKILIN